MEVFERNESEEDGTEIGDGIFVTPDRRSDERPSCQLWVHQEGSVSYHKGYLCEGYDPPVYWFPDIGEPGWGTSITLGLGAFEQREDAVTAAKEHLTRQAVLIKFKEEVL